MRYRTPPSSPVLVIDVLESRFFLAAQINFPSFASTTHLVANGFGANPVTSGNHVRMTDGDFHEARTVWFDTVVPIQKFDTDFTFRAGADPNNADGLTFTVQNGPTTALGTDGMDLGYQGIGNSQAVCFNMFNFANYGSKFGFASNGQTPPTNTDMAPFDLHNGHLLHATVKYDGTTLAVSISDAASPATRFNASKAIDLPAAIGSGTAIVGFTASTGVHVSTQDLVSWKFTGQGIPTVATAASAAPSTVSGNTTTLSVLGDDASGESDLTYTWSLQRSPPGAHAPTFSANGTNGAKSITATFFKDGTYRFRCTIANSSGGSTVSDVSVVVNQTASAIRIDPHKATVTNGRTIDYHAFVLDQFNHKMRTQPSITYAVQTGPGTINASTGLFRASLTEVGHIVIEATSGDLSGVAGGTVLSS